MIRLLPPLRASALLLTLAGAAAAQTDPAPSAPASGAPPLSQIILGFEERGYRLSDIDVDADVIEVEGLGPSGARIEARVDPATGEILSESPED